MNTAVDEPTPKLNSPTKLSIREILQDAWKLTNGVKWPIIFSGLILPTLILLVLGILVVFLAPPKLMMIHHHISKPVFNFIDVIFIAIAAFTFWICLVTMIMLGVRQALGMSVSVKETMRDCLNSIVDIFYLFFVFFLLMMLFSIVSFLFPSLIVKLVCRIAYAYCLLPIEFFAVPLVILKHLSLKEALITSFQRMNKNLGVIFGCYVGMSILLWVSIIPLGIGLIWTIPMYIVMFGLLFKKIYLDVPTEPTKELPPTVEIAQEEPNIYPPEV